MVIDNHAKITVGLVISLLCAVGMGAWWASDSATRLESQERQTRKIWQKLSKVDNINLQLAEIRGELKYIREKLE